MVLLAGLVAGLAVGLAGGPTPGPSRPARFEVVYQVTNSASGQPQSSWEVLSVSGPFDVSDLTYGADPRTGDQPLSGTVTTFDGLYDLAAGRLTLTTDRPPALGSGDQALTPELADLVARRLAVRLGPTRRIAGQPCTVYRFGEPPAGPVTPATAAGHDDLCLAASGLELGETWTYGGRVVLQRTAAEVTMGAPDRRITVAPPAGPGSASTAVVRIGPAQLPTFLVAPPAAAGFRALAPVGVVGYDPSDASRMVGRSTVWAFQRGGDVVTVTAGEGQTPWDDTGTPVGTLRLAGLGSARSALRSDGPQIQVQLPGARWVTVDGTVPLPVLAAYAGRLRLA